MAEYEGPKRYRYENRMKKVRRKETTYIEDKEGKLVPQFYFYFAYINTVVSIPIVSGPKIKVTYECDGEQGTAIFPDLIPVVLVR